MDLINEYAVIVLPKNNIQPWHGPFIHKREAEESVKWLYDNKNKMRLEAQEEQDKEDLDNKFSGNKSRYYYNKIKDDDYKITKRKVTKWEII